MKRIIFISLSLVLATSCTTIHREKSQRPAPFQLMRIPLPIGDTNVLALVYQHVKPFPTFINVHDDENTSVVAGRKVIEQTSGRLIELSHSGHRHVRFHLDDEAFAFDPNRIFSDIGIRATLQRQGAYSDAALEAVKQFANLYLERFALDREPAIIALHNNSEGALTIRSYLPGGEHADTSAEVHVASNHSTDDFFYVTDRRFFDYLKARDFNVTFQDNANVPDDGSLSVYFGKRGIPYLNIEAEINHLDAQTEMVRVAREMVVSLIESGKRDGS